MTKFFEYRRIVTFQETNLIGNVYFAHFVAWQGACREMFLYEKAPEILAELDRGLVLSTVSCSCKYGVELQAFDQVVIRMRLSSAVWNRVVLEFGYYREVDGELEKVASGEQEIACMQRESGVVVDREIPASLLQALEPYRDPGS